MELWKNSYLSYLPLMWSSRVVPCFLCQLTSSLLILTPELVIASEWSKLGTPLSQSWCYPRHVFLLPFRGCRSSVWSWLSVFFFNKIETPIWMEMSCPHLSFQAKPNTVFQKFSQILSCDSSAWGLVSALKGILTK